MAKLWRIEYQVKCKFKNMHSFPIDMLRYDNSFPYDNEAWDSIIEAFNPEISKQSIPVQLFHDSHGNKKWLPTFDRWESFGFNVIMESINVKEVFN